MTWREIDKKQRYDINGRFWVFAGDDYYPVGGMADYKGSHATEDEATKAVHEWFEYESQDGFQTDEIKWVDVLDTETGEYLAFRQDPESDHVVLTNR